MPPPGFEPAILAGERLQTQVLDRSATGIGKTTVKGVQKTKKQKYKVKF
jgi:hypothetical protein